MYIIVHHSSKNKKQVMFQPLQIGYIQVTSQPLQISCPTAVPSLHRDTLPS